MKIRYDKFKVGDLITWFDEEYAQMTGGASRYGRDLIVKKVEDIPYEKPDFLEDTQSNWEGMGHTQMVWIDDDPDPNHQFSGAFFKLRNKETVDEALNKQNQKTIKWTKVTPEVLEEIEREHFANKGAYFLVKTNGGEWRDLDLHVMYALQVIRKSQPDYVRGRPVYIAKINQPKEA